jgi:LemA protein
MWPAIIILAIILLVPIFIFNTLIGRRNQVKNIFATTDALLKKRYDLLPNLITTVKGYMQHERDLLEQITLARAKAVNPQLSDDDKVDLDNQMTHAMNEFRIAVENYPQLKASENFLHLQRTLNELEEQISAARRAYNASVMDYNNAVQMFPTNIVATLINFKAKKYFETPERERENIDAGKILNT